MCNTLFIYTGMEPYTKKITNANKNKKKKSKKIYSINNCWMN